MTHELHALAAALADLAHLAAALVTLARLVKRPPRKDGPHSASPAARPQRAAGLGHHRAT
jgi:hypothetical protein